MPNQYRIRIGFGECVALCVFALLLNFLRGLIQKKRREGGGEDAYAKNNINGKVLLSPPPS